MGFSRPHRKPSRILVDGCFLPGRRWAHTDAPCWHARELPTSTTHRWSTCRDRESGKGLGLTEENHLGQALCQAGPVDAAWLSSDAPRCLLRVTTSKNLPVRNSRFATQHSRIRQNPLPCNVRAYGILARFVARPECEKNMRKPSTASAGLGAKLRENAFILNDIQEKLSGGTRRVTMNAHDLHDQSIGYTPPALDMKSSPRHCRLFPVLPPRLAHASKQNCVYTIRNRAAKAAEGGPMCAPPSHFA